MRSARVHAAASATSAVSLVLLVASCASCGYGIGYPRTGPVASASSVAVPIFANASHEAGVELIFTEALRRELALDPATGVRGAGDAELTITGTVAQLVSAPISFLQGGKGLAIGEYNVVAVVTVEARLKGKAAPVYANTFSGTEQYLSANDPSGTESNRRIAIGRLARRLMREAHEMMRAAF